jgi:hypothetical protein
MKLLGTEITRNIETEMFSYLPQEYADYRESKAIIQSEAIELEALNDAISDVLAQFYIDTATWGLADWEKVCGVTPDELKPIEERRSLIKAKMRGTGVVTTALIQNVVSSYTGGDVEITEDFASYNVKVKFVSTYGVPTNMTDVQKVVRDILPAHLGLVFEFKYPLWSDWNTANRQWSAINTDNKTWTQYESGL